MIKNNRKEEFSTQSYANDFPTLSESEVVAAEANKTKPSRGSTGGGSVVGGGGGPGLSSNTSAGSTSSATSSTGAVAGSISAQDLNGHHDDLNNDKGDRVTSPVSQQNGSFEDEDSDGGLKKVRSKKGKFFC